MGMKIQYRGPQGHRCEVELASDLAEKLAEFSKIDN